ncbi:MAG TPA: non-ribosomal peptide synthetase [Gaiellaceae bacterium]|nr:non-ribosomal peptide synthetase [Gaiellaceae bacterium]
MRTIGALLERSALDPAAPAILAPGRGTLAYGELRALVAGTAGGLRAAGLGPESRVALVVENGPEAATAFLSIADAAVVAPLNPAYGARELGFYLDDLAAEAVVVGAALSTPARDVARERGIRVVELAVDPSAPAGAFVLDGVAREDGVEPGGGPERPALLLHTSGTTSRPKLVPLTHGRLAESAAAVAQTLRLGPADRCLNVMPLFHIHGLVAALLASIEAGASVCATPGFHQLRFFDWLEELEPTWYTAVPTMHAAVLARLPARPEAVAGHRLRFVRSSSAALQRPVLEGLERAFGVPVIEAYGMTEAAHQMASNPLPPDTRRPGTVGRAAGPEIAILDGDGAELGPGEIGEVAVRGPSVFDGYEANPEANAAAFTNGWFRTGDEGSLDADGYLTLRGRLKEIINRGGEKISPLEVDEALLRHAGVAQAVAFGVADPRLGEEVAAAVVLAPGTQPPGERELQDFVAEQLAPFKVPRRILVVDEIPKGPTGKMQRIGLAERLGMDPGGTNGRGENRPPYAFLEHELVAIWESVLDIPDLGVADDFFALGGDSILAAEAVARIRELVGDRDLPLTAIVRAPTPASMAQEVFAGAGTGRSGIVPLRPDGARPPLFLVHPGDGDVLAYPILARLLDPEQPSYALRARGIDDGGVTGSSISELAAEYVDDIRGVQPEGPYLLGGFCLGGPIAAEMAVQLEAAGEETAMVVLIDPRFRRPEGARYAAWLAGRRAREGRLAAAVAARMERLVGAGPEPLQMSPVHAALARIREEHRPQPIDVPATVVLSRGFDRFALPERYLASIVRNPSRWTRVEGEHTRLLLPPLVHQVAREVQAALDEAPAAVPA